MDYDTIDISEEKRDELISSFKEKLADKLANNKESISKEFVLEGKHGEAFEEQYLEAKEQGADAWGCFLKQDWVEDSFPAKYDYEKNYSWEFNCDPFDSQLRGYVETNGDGEVQEIYIQGE